MTLSSTRSLTPRGHSRCVIEFDSPQFGCQARNTRHHRFTSVAKDISMSTDPFSASIIPFEVPESVRAFAEKGVSQARDNYAKFKDAAENQNSTIEAVFTSASKGASVYSSKLMEFMKANTTSTLDFAQELLGVKSPSEALELWTGHSRKQFETFNVQ